MQLNSMHRKRQKGYWKNLNNNRQHCIIG